MGKPSLQIGSGNWGVKDDVLLGYSINDKNEYPQILTLGATLPEFKNGQFSLGGYHYDFDGNVINGQQTKIKLVHTAYKFLNAPFRLTLFTKTDTISFENNPKTILSMLPSFRL